MTPRLAPRLDLRGASSPRSAGLQLMSHQRLANTHSFMHAGPYPSGQDVYLSGTGRRPAAPPRCCTRTLERAPHRPRTRAHLRRRPRTACAPRASPSDVPPAPGEPRATARAIVLERAAHGAAPPRWARRDDTVQRAARESSATYEHWTPQGRGVHMHTCHRHRPRLYVPVPRTSVCQPHSTAHAIDSRCRPLATPVFTRRRRFLA